VSSNLVSIPPSTSSTYTVTATTHALRHGFYDKAFINIITNGGDDRITAGLSVSRPIRRSPALNFILALLVAFVPLALVFLYLPLEFWQEPRFWVAGSIYCAVVAGVFACHVPDKKKKSVRGLK